jgi:hypothetical protein
LLYFKLGSWSAQASRTPCGASRKAQTLVFGRTLSLAPGTV